ncbi:magnesium-translocating P-type ATPase [Streptomyces sp. SPB78]|nr:magnesium-translocating P-type ATPase [Streptomyces sp. SPB78]
MLAVATARRAARPGRGYTPADERGLALAGFVTFRDPPVAGVAGALRELTGLGVEVRVLTGDQPGTAARACRELGLDPGEVVDMRALAALPEAERAVRAARGRVFARCAPEDKAWLVARTRAAGRVTGFLGDGWNDVPALRAADVGLCPPGAVALAREHADLVLGGKDLGAVAHAVRAGRSGTATVLAYLRAALSSNLGNVVAMLVAGLLLPFLPMLPAQVLVQNLCFDLAQTAYVRRGAAARPSARPVPLRTRALVRQILGYGALNAGVDVLTFAALRGARGCGGDAVAGALPRGVVHREPAHAGARARGAAAGGGPGAEGAVGGRWPAWSRWAWRCRRARWAPRWGWWRCRGACGRRSRC